MSLDVTSHRFSDEDSPRLIKLNLQRQSCEPPAMWPPILAEQVDTGRTWDCLTMLPIVPKPVMIAAVRLATGHDYLQAHIQKNRTDTDQCSLCNNSRMVTMQPSHTHTHIHTHTHTPECTKPTKKINSKCLSTGHHSP
jgi:hypothetical protein